MSCSGSSDSERCFTQFTIENTVVLTVVDCEYSLSDILERIYRNQLAFEATIMEITLHLEQQGSREIGQNVRGALEAVWGNAGYIKQGLARLKEAGFLILLNGK
ncbi:UNVERIFIED_ORG: hypothetical protein J2W82_005054 [Pseudomonas mohnii]|nr:hypothetical protein [Pseudomonas mohnii]